MSVFRNLWRALVPEHIRALLFNLKSHVQILEFETGHYRSAKEKACVDRDGNPLPWFSYPAIEYLRQLDFSDKAVFEYGAGNSTRFWAARAQQVVSVESSPLWYNRLKPSLTMPHVTFVLQETEAAYIGEIDQHGTFDVIVVDGLYRLECAKAAVPHLKPGGMIIFDNADRFVKSTAYLRSADLIQVDLFGFGPLLATTNCTSVFLRRDFNFRPAHAVQPTHGIGSPRQLDERDEAD